MPLCGKLKNGFIIGELAGSVISKYFCFGKRVRSEMIRDISRSTRFARSGQAVTVALRRCKLDATSRCRST